MAKILCPLTSSNEVEPLADSGADEFFCGFLDERYVRSSRMKLQMNFRASLRMNFTSYSDMKNALDASSRRGIPVYLTLNVGAFSSAQTRYIHRIIRRLAHSS